MAIGLCGAGLSFLILFGRTWFDSEPQGGSTSSVASLSVPRQLTGGKLLTVWWDALEPDVRDRATLSGKDSNIHPADYIGPHSCQQCHPRNYDSWSKHPHRWMNALAAPTMIKGEFSGASITYRGGQATFYRDGDRFLMRYERDGMQRLYHVTQTIGSRFFQYYVGRLIAGPEPKSHHFYERDHVLHFGYWLNQKEWAPVIHIGPEMPDDRRVDPFVPAESGSFYAEYARSCNYCHTTFPLGDLYGRVPRLIGEHPPAHLHWSIKPYLDEAHPKLARSFASLMERSPVTNPMANWDAPSLAVTHGISCEACHLGTKAHVGSKGAVPPKFFPSSPHLHVEKGGGDIEFGRSHANVNWACARCHTGSRPQFAAGMSTWNSVEYSDAVRGSCYSKLRCIDCHNPHREIGPKWSLSADQDDGLCLKCHDQLKPAAQRVKHTHHPMGSEGARCMNCHMPRINEGLQDVVRTHMIYSPTRADMLEANHPNACNLCHTGQPIDWTLRYLKEWYGATYDQAKIAANYPDRAKPVAHGWLRSDKEAVRLVACESLVRDRDFKSLPLLCDALDDPYLVNRQFAYKGLQEMLNVRLADFGYRFYMSSAERAGPLAAIRAKFSAK